MLIISTTNPTQLHFSSPHPHYQLGALGPPDSWATSHLLTATCHLPPATCHLPPATCHLPPANCHLPPATCQLPPANCHLPEIISMLEDIFCQHFFYARILFARKRKTGPGGPYCCSGRLQELEKKPLIGR